MDRRAERGFSLVEMLISMTIVLVGSTVLAQLMVKSSQINKSQQLVADVQSNARNCLALIEQRLRSAGWDPMNVDIPSLALDPDLTDDVSQIEVYADFDNDGVTDSDGEQVLIRHTGNQVQWRTSNDVSAVFRVVASHISNDADGDGTPEAMFTPNSVTDPSRITIRITAESPVRDPVSGGPIRFTVTSDVVLRKAL